MRELTTVEMQTVSGAGVFDFIGSVVVGAAAGITAFGLKWAMSGGSTGGVLGVGIISGGVGLIVGAVVGLVDGALYGAMNGWETTAGWFNNIVENQLDLGTGVITA
ncbi:hypothetical protein F3I27_19655 [Pantoea sp. Bo_2]|uniref:Colicin V synthesis protein n=1 Tax=Candidatus Pantoea gossypiicola TaxID=2608008 RepID=A0AB34CGB8_9GAMM|nr:MULTISPECIES: hypothetical protein [Pantoea]KAA5927432.1 hypothetical protein F3I59_16175 [Pantoea sp. VH_8]KAA5931771.1 hypothetical protein F3I58_16770 [Pantoea sp. VH_4]KAA5939489.1 hypothetical protein F3I57_19260 [Pantoea sp. VH_3]KAA5948457.1 hypothetical protein F3I56_20180 [Pantoea sp. VH_25]KAA5951517.1 hypothetical protein F3I55_19365 [Pantoea sp. VH_24]